MGKISLLFNEEECMGCHACEVACKQEHGLAAGPKVLRVLERAPFFRPLYCHHCEDAPCARACPESAITADPQTGVVLHDPEKCTGCNAVAGKSGAEKQDTSACKTGCPAHINVQGYVSLAASGKFREALALIKEASPFPSICGRVCPHPCEAACAREQIDQPVAIHAVERFLGDLDLLSGTRYRPEIKEKKEEKVAVVGSGPAGLTCAYYLARKGYRVTILEKAPVLGGMLAAGIPAYRLPRDILAAEIALIADLGVRMETGVEVGRDRTFTQLRREGFKAFFLAVGAQKSLRLGIAGEELDNVYPGLEYLRQVNLGEPPRLGKTVAVIGGGNVALDAVRAARRLGSEQAFILYRRGLEEMPARREEIEACRQEGIAIHTLAQPVRFIGENGRVKAMECLKTCLTEPDATGRPRPEPVSGTEFTLVVDAVITASGQEPDWICLTGEGGVSLNDRGALLVDPLTRQSAVADIFAGGDAIRGPQTVIEAIADGREAAVSIDRYLRGENLKLGRDLAWKAITAPCKDGYNPVGRVQIPWLDMDQRAENFLEVELGLPEDLVIQEAGRCITCGSSCVQSCPYDVMQFNQETIKAVKCDLCVVKRGENELPACFAICPTRCIFWGDPEDFPQKAYGAR